MVAIMSVLLYLNVEGKITSKGKVLLTAKWPLPGGRRANNVLNNLLLNYSEKRELTGYCY